jgi:hypothetical protein
MMSSFLLTISSIMVYQRRGEAQRPLPLTFPHAQRAPARDAKASKRIDVSTGGFLFTTFWKSLHDFLSEGWGYDVGFTGIGWNELGSFQLRPKKTLKSRRIGWPRMKTGEILLGGSLSHNLVLS